MWRLEQNEQLLRSIGDMGQAMADWMTALVEEDVIPLPYSVQFPDLHPTYASYLRSLPSPEAEPARILLNWRRMGALYRQLAIYFAIAISYTRPPSYLRYLGAVREQLQLLDDFPNKIGDILVEDPTSYLRALLDAQDREEPLNAVPQPSPLWDDVWSRVLETGRH